MKLTYNGPLKAVHVPALGAVVAEGESVEVTDPDLAADLAEQGWSEVAPPKARKGATSEED